jgi:hypothetical protein
LFCRDEVVRRSRQSCTGEEAVIHGRAIKGYGLGDDWFSVKPLQAGVMIAEMGIIVMEILWHN